MDPELLWEDGVCSCGLEEDVAVPAPSTVQQAAAAEVSFTLDLVNELKLRRECVAGLDRESTRISSTEPPSEDWALYPYT